MKMFAERSKQPLENITVKKRKLRFGLVSRSSGLAKTFLQGTVKGNRSRQTKRWEDSIKGWICLNFASSAKVCEDRSRRKEGVVKSSVVPQQLPKFIGPTNLDKISIPISP